MFALLPVQRGLSIAEVGVIFGVYTATAAILELPTGTLADIVGRRPVLVIAAVMETACFAGFLVAETVVHFCLAVALGGVGRALNSGALEAWYVDGVYTDKPGTDVRRAIGTAMFLTNVAMLAGALTVALTVAVLPLVPAGQWAGEPAPGRRASVLSAYSMSSNAGAVVGSVGLGTVLGGQGVSMIWLAAAATVALAGIAYLRLPHSRATTATVTSRVDAAITG